MLVSLTHPGNGTTRDLVWKAGTNGLCHWFNDTWLAFVGGGATLEACQVESFDQLLKHADAALHRAKTSGRNVAIVDDATAPNCTENLALN